MTLLGTRQPSGHLFVHTLAHFTPTFTKDTAGAKVETFGLVNDDIKAFVQPAPSDIINTYRQLDENVTHQAFTLNESAWGQIQIQDRLVFNGLQFSIVSKEDPCELDRVWRVVIAIDHSAPVDVAAFSCAFGYAYNTAVC